MGDVVTALGRAVQDEGHRVEVILPKYDCMDYDQVHTPARQLIQHRGTAEYPTWRQSGARSCLGLH